MHRAISRRTFALLLALFVLTNLIVPVWARPARADASPAALAAQTEAVDSALAWLRSQQQADGSFAGGFGSNLSPSIQVLMSLASVGQEPRLWNGSSGASLMDYLASEAASISDAGTAGRLAAALVMANENPHRFGGVNLLSIVQDQYDPATGSYDPHSNIWNHALALWGLVAAHETVPPHALTWLKEQQNDDGGWGWAAQQDSDTNSTALAIQALLGGGVPAEEPSIAAGILFLKKQQLPDGGFAYDSSFSPDADANSTALVIQGFIAAGACRTIAADGSRSCAGDDEPSVATRRAMDRLLAFQGPDGAFEWQTGQGSNLLSTAQAFPALAGIPFPQLQSIIPGSDPTRPKPFPSETPLNGASAGSRAGAYVFYATAYPGDGSDITVRMTFIPDNPAISRGLGFVIYGPGGRSAKGSPTGIPGERKATFSSTTPGTLLVQVYNYIDGLTLRYMVSR